MGVIYSPERVAAGHVPEPGAHQAAGRHILSVLSHLQTEVPAFLGGMIYGSATFGASRRSDLDVLAVFDESVGDDELAILDQLYSEIDALYHLKPEPNTIVTGPYSTPDDHMLDTLFGVHLAYTQDTNPDWVIGRPVDHIPFEPLNEQAIWRIIRRYLAHKERRLLKSRTTISMGNESMADLQRAFELPSAVGRKAIAAIDYDPHTDHAQGGRAALEKRSAELLGDDKRALAAQHALLQINAEYNATLEAALSGEVSLASYEKWPTTNYAPSIAHGRQLASSWKAIVARLDPTTRV